MKSKDENIRVVLTGGGSGGPVTPLLALAEELSERFPHNLSMMWIGTNQGIERSFTAPYQFIYKAIVAGKLRRYFDLRNVTDLFKIIIGFVQSYFILRNFRPRLIITAGSFLSVPVVWAACLLKINVLVHQQDIRPGLANKLMSRCAKTVTVVFGKSLDDFGSKSIWTGNPVRKEFKKFALSQAKRKGSKPCVVILGGGTGSEEINRLVLEAVGDITPFASVIHITGRSGRWSDQRREPTADYQYYELLENQHIAEALSGADLVVTRAGLGTLTELSYLGKPCIIIPIPSSHQEENAAYFSSRGAAIVLQQRGLTPDAFARMIKKTLNDKELLLSMSQKIHESMKHDANEKMTDIITKMIEE